MRTDLDSAKLIDQLLKSQFCCKKLFWNYSGRVRSGRVHGNIDNRANSAQLQVKFQTGAELGKNTKNSGLPKLLHWLHKLRSDQ